MNEQEQMSLEAFRLGVDLMKTCITTLVEAMTGAPTFEDLAREIRSFGGGAVAFGSSQTNVFYWVGLTAKAACAMCELIAEQKIQLRACGRGRYKPDGLISQLPRTSDRKRAYSEPRLFLCEIVKAGAMGGFTERITIDDVTLSQAIEAENFAPIVQTYAPLIEQSNRDAYFGPRLKDAREADLYYILRGGQITLLTDAEMAEELRRGPVRNKKAVEIWSRWNAENAYQETEYRITYGDQDSIFAYRRVRRPIATLGLSAHPDLADQIEAALRRDFPPPTELPPETKTEIFRQIEDLLGDD